MCRQGSLWYLAFTAVFAVLAGFLFWGTWSTTVSFISPDDGVVFATSYGDVVQRWWNDFLLRGKILPTDLLWSGLFGSPHVCRELKYAVALYLSAFALAWFLRGRGISRLSAYGAGLLLAFSGYWCTLFSAGHGGWYIWMSYGLFAFGLIDRAVTRGSWRYWILLGLAVSWAGFQQQDLWLLFSAFTGVYLVYRLVRARAFPWTKIVAAGLVFLVVGLPNWVNLCDVVKGREDQIARGENITTESDASKKSLEDRAARWEFVTNWSLPADETAEFFSARLNGDTSCPFVLSINAKRGVRPYSGALGRPMNAEKGNYRQHSLYLGWGTCLLAIIGAAGGFRRKTVLFFVCAAVVFYLLSLGRYFAPAYRCVFALPAGDLIRCPVKWHHLTEFCVCVLAGFGLDTLQQLLARVPVREAVRARLVPALVAALVLFWSFDLVSEARRFCAPVDYSQAIAKKCESQLTVLSRQQFQNPQVAAMVRAGALVSVANWLGSPDAYLVQALQPAKPVKPAEPRPLMIALGAISFLAALACIGMAWRLPLR